MVIDKGELSKTLRAISHFDNNACPYLAVQFPATGKPQYHRSSNDGFIQTKDFDLLSPHIFASLERLKDLLNVSADAMDMSIDISGQLKLASMDEYPTRLQVHTVRNTNAGWKPHILGNPSHIRLGGNLFEGLDIRPFKSITQPPALSGNRLLVSTLAGVLIWTGSDELKAAITHPRESFLRFVSGSPVEEILISKQGYWLAERDGLLCGISAHAKPTELFTVYSAPSTEVTQLDADRFLTSLSHVAYLIGDNDTVDINPREGIVCLDKYNHQQVFPIGCVTTGWSKISILGRTAKFIVDALSQNKDEIAVLSNVALTNPTCRVTRGSFEVNFRLCK